MSEPYFMHDCEKCVFLGQVQRDSRDGPDHTLVDVYWCKHSSGAPTVVGRYGHLGAQCTSKTPPEAYLGGATLTKSIEIAPDWYLFALLQAAMRGLYDLPCLAHDDCKDNSDLSLACSRGKRHEP